MTHRVELSQSSVSCGVLVKRAICGMRWFSRCWRANEGGEMEEEEQREGGERSKGGREEIEDKGGGLQDQLTSAATLSSPRSFSDSLAAPEGPLAYSCIRVSP